MEPRIIGARIRTLREAKGWTQGQLAYKADTTAAQISRIENNERPGVQAVTIGKIAVALDTTVEYLMGQTGNPTRQLPSSGNTHDTADAVLQARFNELLRRWRLVDRYAPDQLETLINIAYTQAELVLGAAKAAERLEEKEDRENRT